jgi:hypothetical protein
MALAEPAFGHGEEGWALVGVRLRRNRCFGVLWQKRKLRSDPLATRVTSSGVRTCLKDEAGTAHISCGHWDSSQVQPLARRFSHVCVA